MSTARRLVAARLSLSVVDMCIDVYVLFMYLYFVGSGVCIVCVLAYKVSCIQLLSCVCC